MNQLPIDHYQNEIENTIARNPITLLTAETGAGKSTRVPYWMWKKGKVVHVTQPRRIATRSLSLYLAQTSGITLGQEIGYQTGFDSIQSKKTTLLYATDGVQMIREIKRRRDYDILILDEIHEWNLNQEVLIGIVKQNLDRNYYKKSGKRVVIMSATLEAKQLSAFLGNAPIISVPGRGYPVALHHNNPHFLLPDTAQMVELEKNVLVFQPGKQEIDNFSDDLKRMLDAEKLKAKILPLHSELSLKEQALVFEHYPIPKVIVATDIAQTSLTIDDIDAVVDCGIKKELRLIRGIEGLYPVDISASECMQRAGRAGRVKNGQYFLCADAGIKDRSPFPDPEIQRLNLESVTLRLIKMGISPLDFPFFHAPSKALIFKAIKQLKLLGAIDDDGNVTEDGNQMAELPVSLRSARLLLEAQKGNPQTVDGALKCIAILETKGIVSKDYTGEKLANFPYNSDLLNQLILWQSAKMHRQIINFKKFGLAQEIYKELKKRIDLPPSKKNISLKDMDALFRAILSSFADAVYIRGGEEYQRENDIRQIERTSVLFLAKPDMLVGLPFDLVINRENKHTQEIEMVSIPLITFNSELTLQLLDTLKPFSYHKEEKILVQTSKVSVFREFYFGGKIVKSFYSPPNWQDPIEMENIVKAVLPWYDENKDKFEVSKRLLKLELLFEEIKPIIKPLMKSKLKSFDYYRKGFLMREIRSGLKIEDLNLFFNIHRGFEQLHFKKLLSFDILKKLKKLGWPTQHYIESINQQFEIRYVDSKPFIHLDYPQFERIKEEELLLPTGEWLNIVLGEHSYDSWDIALFEFNRWKKIDTFEKKFKNLKKPGNMEDIQDLPFPQPFEGGRGKDNTPFEFYLAPYIAEEQSTEDGKSEKNVYLIHFFEQPEAQNYFESIRSEWEETVKLYKKSKIEDIFKQKGWKVK